MKKNYKKCRSYLLPYFLFLENKICVKSIFCIPEGTENEIKFILFDKYLLNNNVDVKIFMIKQNQLTVHWRKQKSS